MTTALAKTSTELDPKVVESVLLDGDLAKLTPKQRLDYYLRLCESLDLNPLSKPFAYIRLNNRLTMYAQKNATDQLRQKRGITVEISSKEMRDDLYVVWARAKHPAGRQDEDVGAVNVQGLKGDALCNAIMKAVTKAKRRVTLSICGLGGLMDETEIETVPAAVAVMVNEKGEVLDDPARVERIAATPAEVREVARKVIDETEAQEDGVGFSSVSALAFIKDHLSTLTNVKAVTNWKKKYGERFDTHGATFSEAARRLVDDRVADLTGEPPEPTDDDVPPEEG